MLSKKHSSRKHAVLSASGASRWINCPPSIRLSENIKSTSSVFANEGTLAHEIADFKLRAFNREITEGRAKEAIDNLSLNKLFTQDMIEEVDKYVSYVIETFNTIKQDHPDAVLMIEQKLDFSHIVEEGFGTGDTIIVANNLVWVIDLKYGKGISVSADDNYQLMLYGLGALREYEMLYDINTVRLVVFQPRLDSVSVWDISVDDIYSWAEETVKPAAKLAFAGEGVQKPGDHCRFCLVKNKCAALADMTNSVAAYEFQKPMTLTDDELLRIYAQIPTITSFLKSLNEYVLKQALSGKQFNGYKLVEGRGRRVFTDDKDVIERMDDLGFDQSEYLTSKLAGIIQIQNLFSVDSFKEHMSDLIKFSSGAPKLVNSSDKRPAMGNEQAKLDFAD